MNFLELAVSLAVALSDTTVCHNDVTPHTIGSPGPSYAVQYYFVPSMVEWHQLIRWGFVANDDATVWPGAGGLVILPDSGVSRFPTLAELAAASAMTPPFQAAHDTATVVIDLADEWVAIPPFTPEAAMVAVLEVPTGFPDTTQVGVGTGFLLADKLGTECSFYTPDGGVSWFVLVNHEWAWAAEIGMPTTSDVPDDDCDDDDDDCVAVVPRTWTQMKKVYRE